MVQGTGDKMNKTLKIRPKKKPGCKRRFSKNDIIVEVPLTEGVHKFYYVKHLHRRETLGYFIGTVLQEIMHMHMELREEQIKQELKEHYLKDLELRYKQINEEYHQNMKNLREKR